VVLSPLYGEVGDGGLEIVGKETESSFEYNAIKAKYPR